MKKTIFITILAILLAVTGFAQKESKKFSVGLGLEAGVPTGDYSDFYHFATGLTIRFSWHTGPGFITLTTGAIGFAPKKVEGQSTKLGLEIPVRAGYKFITNHHFFVMGEIGFASLKSYYGSQGEVQSVTSSSFIAAPSAGFQFDTFEVSLRYELITKDNAGTLGLRLGFNF